MRWKESEALNGHMEWKSLLNHPGSLCEREILLGPLTHMMLGLFAVIAESFSLSDPSLGAMS